MNKGSRDTKENQASNRMTTETRVKILISLVLVIGLAVFGSIVFLFSKWPIWSVVGVAGLSLFWTLGLIVPTPKNKTARKLYKLLYYPWAALTILFRISKPTVGIMGAYLFAFAVSMMPTLLIFGMYAIICGIPDPALCVFLAVATSTILLSNHTNLIKRALKKFFVWHVWNENDAQKEFVKIGEYVLQPGNVHFVVSLLYVVFLVFYALQSIIKYTPILPPILCDAILKAFLVYVAYSTMMKRYDEQEISTEGMAREILAMYHWKLKESSDDKKEPINGEEIVETEQKVEDN